MNPLNLPIPTIKDVDGWKTLPIVECGEPLVSIGSFSNYWRIATDSIYWGERTSSPYPSRKLKGSLVTIFVRKGVAEQLAQVSALLPPQHMLLVWDAYRPLAVQQALFDYYVSVLESRGTPHEQAIIDAQKFVSIPSDDPTRPPPHNTGGAVDLTIIRFSPKDWRRMEYLTSIVEQPETRDSWREIFKAEMERIELIRTHSIPLNMGTVFDGVHPETATRFYEGRLLSLRKRRIRRNRRLLYNAMITVGFSNYGEEWWHYDFGNQFDMARTGRPAIYGPAVFTTDNQRREDIRAGHYEGCVAIATHPHPLLQGKLGITSIHPQPFLNHVVVSTGNLRETCHPQAAAL